MMAERIVDDIGHRVPTGALIVPSCGRTSKCRQEAVERLLARRVDTSYGRLQTLTTLLSQPSRSTGPVPRPRDLTFISQRTNCNVSH